MLRSVVVIWNLPENTMASSCGGRKVSWAISYSLVAQPFCTSKLYSPCRAPRLSIQASPSPLRSRSPSTPLLYPPPRPVPPLTTITTITITVSSTSRAPLTHVSLRCLLTCDWATWQSAPLVWTLRLSGRRCCRWASSRGWRLRGCCCRGPNLRSWTSARAHWTRIMR